MTCLKRMFNLGRRSTPPKVFHLPAFPRLAERNVRKGFVEDGEYQKLAEGAATTGLWLRAMPKMGHTFGWRVSELLTLRVNQLDLLSRTIRLNAGETKNDDGRVVIMTNTFHQLLPQCAAGKNANDFVFSRKMESGCKTSAEPGRRFALTPAHRRDCSTTCGGPQFETWFGLEY
jgi:integrase